MTILIIDNNLYEINESSVTIYDLGTGKAVSTQNNFNDIFSLPVNTIDAAINWGDGTVYFFKDDQYYSYNTQSGKVEDGYPKNIADGWPGLWTANIWAAVRKNDKAYFFADEEYIRYDCTANTSDEGYPLKIAPNWSGFPASINGIAILNDQFALIQNNSDYLLYDWNGDVVVSTQSDSLENSLQLYLQKSNGNTPPDEADTKRIIVKLSDTLVLPNGDFEQLDASQLEQFGYTADDASAILLEKIKTISPLYDNNLANDLNETASALKDDEYTPPNFKNYLAFELEPDAAPDALFKILTKENYEFVDFAYLASKPIPAVINPADEPQFVNQGYLKASPDGVDAVYAFSNGFTGASVKLTDVEYAFDTGHQDLPVISVIFGTSAVTQNFSSHGTGVLGIIGGKSNKQDVIGIVPNAAISFSSMDGNKGEKAVAEAVKTSSHGNVILLEMQTGHSYPKEFELAYFDLIRLATKKGITVIEAAGNGAGNGGAGFDLDTVIPQDVTLWFFKSNKNIFNRNSADFIDSGAVLVGAASSASPHTRMSFSNFGSRVDVYAWGQNVTTLANNNGTTNSFNGTSSASAIIAGVAAMLQNMAFKEKSFFLNAFDTRKTLSENGTDSATPANDKIGKMPSLNKIHNAIKSNF
jgi:hypothetical protein